MSTGLASLDKLHKKHGAHKMKRVLKKNVKSKRKLPAKAQKLCQGLLRIYKVKLKKGTDVLRAVSDYQNDPNIEYAEPNYIYDISSTYPNDPDFGLLWGLHNTGQNGNMADADIDAPEAWDINTGSNNIVVAVIDTGVDYNHQDLSANMWTNTGEIPGNDKDDDNNGYIDDVYGINAITGSGDPMDDNFHGTHCAGTIGAVGDNNTGLAGVNWNVSIMALKFLNYNGTGDTSNGIACIDYAIDMGADIMNNSWGGASYSQSLKDAISVADAAGLLFIAAAGNNGLNNNDKRPHYPSSYDNKNIIAVAATDKNDVLAGFSNYGLATVDVAAPGVNIYSCLLNNSYGYLNGTSMAAPHVSGLAALIWAEYEADSISYMDVKARILCTVDPISSLSGMLLTGGRINAYGALTETIVAEGPHIFSLYPDHGPVGLKITIYGDNFGDVQGSSQVIFYNGISASVTSWSDTRIECIVPSGAVDGVVTVIITGEASNNKEFVVCPYNTYYRDADEDGYGDINNTIQDCSPPQGYITDNTDCNDSTPCVNSGAVEICNGEDDNCNGQVDEGCQINTVYVPDDYPTIHAAIYAATPCLDEIIVREGIYKENINFLGKEITVRSEKGAVNTIIDADHIRCAVIFNSGEGAYSILDGFTIINGTGASIGGNTFGGAIFCTSSSSPTLRNCIISGNSAKYGGGIHCSNSSSPTIEDCIIRSNSADYGGGITTSSLSTSPKFIGCTIEKNTAVKGGGGFNCYNYSSPIIENCTIRDNLAHDGSGIYCNSSPRIINSTISGNTANNVAGAMLCVGPLSLPVITGCVIKNNSANIIGGAIHSSSDALPTFKDCIISGNFLTDPDSNYGGGIYLNHSSPSISGCTVTGNSAIRGAGIYVINYSLPIIENCIINSNFSYYSGAGISAEHYSSPTIRNCLISGNASSRSSGAGINSNRSSLQITNSVISGNSGSGISCMTSSPTVFNSIIWGNEVNGNPHDMFLARIIHKL